MFSQLLKLLKPNYQRILTPDNNFIKMISVRQYTQQGTQQSDREYNGLVLGLYEQEIANDEPKLTDSGESFNARVNGKISELIKSFNMIGRSGDVNVFTNIPNDLKAVAVVGLGHQGAGYNEAECLDCGRENTRIAAALGCRGLEEAGCTHILVDSMMHTEQAAEGSILSMWRYRENKQPHLVPKIPCVDLFDSPEMDMWRKGMIFADSQNRARRLCDIPANLLTPTNFAQEVVDLLCPCGITVDTRELDWIETQNMNAFLAVARSSCQPPLFMEIKYCGASGDVKPIVLIGEGLTFNTGGLCLKKSEDMSEYRATMSGAACVVATIKAISALTLPINVTGLIPLCENMPSGWSMKPGDVVKSLDGRHILIDDTNKAGVLLLSDALAYAIAAHKPKLIMTLGCVSENIRNSLAAAAAGVYTSNEFLWNQIHKAGVLTGDRVWRMPLWDYFTWKVTDYSKFDINNRGYGHGGSCKSAAFLREFVPCLDYIHMDIRGVGMNCNNKLFPYLRRGRMTGRPTRTIIQFLHQLACPDEQYKELK